MYFINVLLLYGFQNGMLHNRLFLYFPPASVLLFLDWPSPNVIILRIMFSNLFSHVP